MPESVLVLIKFPEWPLTVGFKFILVYIGEDELPKLNSNISMVTLKTNKPLAELLVLFLCVVVNLGTKIPWFVDSIASINGGCVEVVPMPTCEKL